MAERVNLVGQFNDWDTLSTPMTRERADANARVGALLTVILPVVSMAFLPFFWPLFP